MTDYFLISAVVIGTGAGIVKSAMDIYKDFKNKGESYQNEEQGKVTVTNNTLERAVKE